MRSRGLENEEDLSVYRNEPESVLLGLLDDPLPWKRSVGIRLLGLSKDEKYLPRFTSILQKETKLYTKIAVSEVMAGYGQKALDYLLPLLGRIGNNQHKEPVLIDLNKKSFPLPRDIIGRIIIRIGPCAILHLIETLKTGTKEQISEAIDAIGHISFNYSDTSACQALFDLLEKSENNELYKWKIIRAFQAFPDDRVIGYLSDINKYSMNNILLKEAERSLKRIKNQRILKTA